MPLTSLLFIKSLITEALSFYEVLKKHKKCEYQQIYIKLFVYLRYQIKKNNIMELNLNVTVKLDDSSRALIESLANVLSNGKIAFAEKEQKPIKQEPKQEAKQEPKQEAKQEPKKNSDDSISIDEIRRLVLQKIDKHRNAIRAKLTEMNVKSISELDESQYEAFYGFLVDLE